MKKRVFSKIVVVYCILFCSAMSVWAMLIADRDGFQCTGIITVILGVFGGELLLLCLKRIFGDKTKDEDQTTDEKASNEDRDY